MDPNANLKEQRRLVVAILNGTGDEEDVAERAERLAELVEALDEWLTRGGFLPVAWQQTKG